MSKTQLIIGLTFGFVLFSSGCSQMQTAFFPDSDSPQVIAPNADTVAQTQQNTRPVFVGGGVGPQDQTGQIRYIGTMNLFGEMPGAPVKLPEDTLENIQQVSFTREGADFDVAIDSTGQFLVYASTRHRPTSDIYIKKIVGTAVTQLTSDPSNDTMPAISPDGRTVAFCSDRSGNWDIFVKSMQGGKAVQLTSGAGQDLHPSWSPDGKQLIYCSLGEHSGQWELVVVDVANPSRKRYLGYGLFPEFNPTGTKIVFQRARFRGTRWFSVWTMDYENGEGKRPTEIIASTNAAVITPSWSPDGNRLVFATVVNPATDPTSRPHTADLWVINSDGTNRLNLTTDNFVNLQPVWSKTGRIYFVSNRGAADNIWAIRPDQPMFPNENTIDVGQKTAAVPTE